MQRDYGPSVKCCVAVVGELLGIVKYKLVQCANDGLPSLSLLESHHAPKESQQAKSEAAHEEHILLLLLWQSFVWSRSWSSCGEMLAAGKEEACMQAG